MKNWEIGNKRKLNFEVCEYKADSSCLVEVEKKKNDHH